MPSPLLEWLVCLPWIGGRGPTRCPVCKREILTPDDIKQCRFGRKPDIVHKACWREYEAALPDMTTTEAAAYLEEHGHTIGRPWHGGRGPISPRTLRKWCELGKIEGAVKVGEGNRAVWKIPREELDRLIEEREDG